MRAIKRLSYREFQARNTEIFNSLDRESQKVARLYGYNNRGWDNVVNSWEILQDIQDIKAEENNKTDLIEETTQEDWIDLTPNPNIIDFVVARAKKEYNESKEGSDDLWETAEKAQRYLDALEFAATNC